MSDKTAIEWTDATWNPVTGCTEVSPGCDRCYAKTFAERWRGTPGHYFEDGFDVVLRPDKLDQPLRWSRPRRIFVNSMSDLFHKDVPDAFIAQVFAVMALAGHHTFQLLTKRHGRMRSLLSDDLFRTAVYDEAYDRWQPGAPTVYRSTADALRAGGLPWPLPNVWLGVSVEDQQRCDLRVPALLETPAARRFLSCEPLLGPVDVINGIGDSWLSGLDWIIVGGESGHGARPMHPDWARSLRDQAEAAGVAFLFKQWGEWAPIGVNDSTGRPDVYLTDEGTGTHYANRHQPNVEHLAHLGKKAAGRELDGRTWDEFPVGEA